MTGKHESSNVHDIVELARDHPLAMAIIGLGAGWLLYHARSLVEKRRPRNVGERALWMARDRYEENPWVGAAVALAVGAVAGLALPSSNPVAE